MVHLKAIDNKFPLADREKYLSEFYHSSQIPCVAINTCNRLEIYYGEGYISEHIVNHLFRVVAGLESNLIGETAIQGQVKKAYCEAIAKYQLSKTLNQLFQHGLYVGKRVKTETTISRGAISHSQAALEVILQSGINLNKALITLIGAHKLNEDIIKYLRIKGAETIFLANRNFEKAKLIASRFDCKLFRLEQLKKFLSFTDILITATSAPHLIVKESDFPTGKEMLIIDLAFPRDVDERIGLIDNVKLYNLENIEQHVTQNIDKRRVEIEKAEKIIREETVRFFEKQNKHATAQ